MRIPTTARTTVAAGILRFASNTPLAGLANNSVNINGGAVATAAHAIDQDFLTKISTSSIGAIALNLASANNLDFTGLTSASLGATAAVAYTGALTPNAQLYRVGGGTANLTLQTVLADNAGSTSLAKSGNDTVILNQANTYAGTTTVSRGNLTLDFSNAVSPLTDILSTSSSIALSGGTLNLTGKASTTNTQTVTGLAVNAGASALTLSANATANPLLPQSRHHHPQHRRHRQFHPTRRHARCHQRTRHLHHQRHRRHPRRLGHRRLHRLGY